ncbi:MAG: hypothetical protein VZS44_02545 [Bacilli bacterium]|nr:hypothetical protein [Bacilli bacterium]
MNNKGFAITGVLYTVFILFIMVLLSMLSGLNHRMQLLEKSINSYNSSYEISNTNEDENCNIETMNITKKAACTGKYVFNISDNPTVYCITYLKKETSFASNTYNFVVNSTNNAKCQEARSQSKLVLGAFYSFS